MDNFKIINIILRKEIKINEFRTPLIPKDIYILKNNNFNIFVEKCNNRYFKNDEYENEGAIMIEDYTKENFDSNNTLIIGLKELDINNEKHFQYKHMYFSHTFKNQENSEIILKKFIKNNGIIFDLEYFVDVDNNFKRKIAFGFYAGVIGSYLGILQFYHKILGLDDINNIKKFSSFDDLISTLKFIYKITIKPKIAIIGINGRCGSGAKFLLDKLNLNYVGYSRNSNKNNLLENDIIINCILLENQYIEPFITHNQLDNIHKILIIVDVSCDVNNKFNPIPIYKYISDFDYPVIKIKENIFIISIDNLPTLLPKESSSEFSNKLVNIILDINNNTNYWNYNLEYFFNIIKNIS